MSKTIKITESQYQRILLGEQMGEKPWMTPKGMTYDEHLKAQSMYLADIDYHTALDVGSIIALFIPPPVGIGISIALDVINATSYAIEGYNEEDNRNAKGSYIAAGFTLLGATIPGIGLYRTAMRKSAPRALAIVEDAFIKASKEGTTEGTEKVFKEALMGIEDAEVRKSAKKYIDDVVEGVSKNKSYLEKYQKGLKQIESKYNKKFLDKVYQDKKFIKLLQKEGGDIHKAFKTFERTDTFRDIAVQLGFYLAAPHVIEPIAKKAAKEGYLGIKSKVESAGFNWEMVRSSFQSNATEEDNTKLENAWNDEWRPGQVVPDKYQTDSYIKSIASGSINRSQVGASILTGSKEEWEKRLQDTINNKEEWDGTY